MRSMLPSQGKPMKESPMITDPTLVRINQGVQLHHGQGQRVAARDLFAQIWEEINGEQGDPLHVCVLAHAMADVQDDAHEELVWDHRALTAADQLTDARVAQAGVLLPVAGLYPSLHLNLGECYRKLGDLSRAREHLQQAQTGIAELGDDEYAQLIKGGLDRLAKLLTSK
ncbi:tetratricopeptide repeat protein [Micromonospora sp. NPDC003197]